MNTDSEEYRSFRAARNVLEMVGTLHRLGYEALRIHAGLSASGIHWRVEIGTPTFPEKARYSTAQGTQYFGWNDATTDTPQTLAEKFLIRFPAIAAASHKKARKYREWYAAMLLETAPLGVLRQYCDWEEDYNLGIPVMMFEAETIRVPLPPS
jgi:hypothetical protein